MTTRHADLVIDARWVLPVEPDDAVLADHSVVIDGGRIAAVLPTGEVAALVRAGGTPEPARPRADSRTGEPAYARGDVAHARARRRPSADDVAEGAHLAGRDAARFAGVRLRRHAARLRRDAPRRHHVRERHVLLSGVGGAGVPRGGNAREPRAHRHRVPERVRVGRGGLPPARARAPRPARRRAAPVLLHGPARPVHRQRRHVPAHRDARRGTRSADPRARARDGRRSCGERRAARPRARSSVSRASGS